MPVEKFTVRMLIMGPLGYKTNAVAIELNSSKASDGKELSLSSWCIASLYIYHFSAVNFSAGTRSSCVQ